MHVSYINFLDQGAYAIALHLCYMHGSECSTTEPSTTRSGSYVMDGVSHGAPGS